MNGLITDYFSGLSMDYCWTIKWPRFLGKMLRPRCDIIGMTLHGRTFQVLAVFGWSSAFWTLRGSDGVVGNRTLDNQYILEWEVMKTQVKKGCHKHNFEHVDSQSPTTPIILTQNYVYTLSMDLTDDYICNLHHDFILYVQTTFGIGRKGCLLKEERTAHWSNPRSATATPRQRHSLKLREYRMTVEKETPHSESVFFLLCAVSNLFLPVFDIQ
jgi:hypothetical protein